MPKRERNGEQLSFWVPGTLVSEFREICKEKGVSMVSVLVRFLKGYVTREKNKKQPE